MERKFKAAIAYYPDCSATNGDMAAPTLILIGATQRSGKGSSVQLTSTRVLVTDLTPQD
ncbi:hypothetical protein [Mesorhizobium sp. M7A.F.Ce.TU.012.03.2.1]|uniref:hypothetical protein n=1 Tax=unclassified Mesorhizobium TaxID=325217 RepID=UPI0032AF8B2A